MARITLELLRRRAEHNEGCLSNLKELALHQQDLERIELIGDYCRQLEILYLCNNYIAVIEGLRHLKSLTYLNLAINNITVIDGLDGCESLARLDLTLNFVADVTCVRRLQANAHLAELHLTGNPCTQAPQYRAYVVHALPQLRELDGSEVTRSERVVARQDEDEVAARATEACTQLSQQQQQQQQQQHDGTAEAHYNDKGERVYGHSPHERLQMLRDEEQRKRAQDEARAHAEPGSLAALHKELTAKPARLTPEQEMAKYGRLLMRNEAKVPFTLCEDDDNGHGRHNAGAAPGAVVVTVQPGKYLSTTLLDVQVEVNVIRVYIKGALLQLPVSRELAPAAAVVQRSTTTGELKITVPLAAHELQRPRRRHAASATHDDDDNNDNNDTTAVAAARVCATGRADAATTPALPSRSDLRICAEATRRNGDDDEGDAAAAVAAHVQQKAATCKSRVTVLRDDADDAARTSKARDMHALD